MNIKKLVEDSDAVLIGAGAGLSEAAGIHFAGEEFKEDFKDYIKKYHFENLYYGSFYDYKTEEEKWAFWAKQIYYSYFKHQKVKLYEEIYNLVKDKPYFVITTNVDGKFIQNGFSKDKVFEVQGTYNKIQCSVPCHNKLYDDEKIIKEMIKNTDKDLKVPTSLIPHCPVCGKSMEVNVRSNERFVEDKRWHEMDDKYNEFIKKYKDKKLLLLEFGVGFNTPSIIRYPFENMTYYLKNTKLVRFNDKYPEVPEEIKEKSISLRDINDAIE